MKEIKSKKQSHFIKKFFIKICRILGYELIDQSTLEFPVSNKDFQNFISEPGKKSISLGDTETENWLKKDSSSWCREMEF